MKLRLIFVVIVIILSCKKIEYYPDVLIEIQESKVIAHRATKGDIPENSLRGAKAALPFADGIEFDVQISKDQEVWLSHSEIVMDCDKEIKCFPETRDEVIQDIKSCNGLELFYTRIDSVFKLVRDSFPEKMICIDLKGWFPCSGNSLDIDGMMRKEAELIIEKAKFYRIEKNILFEIETTTVLEFIKLKSTRVGTFLNSYGDLERAMLICLKQGYTGISFKTAIGEELTEDKIDLLHRKGLKLIAWNVRDSAQLNKYVDMGVDFVQFDLK